MRKVTLQQYQKFFVERLSGISDHMEAVNISRMVLEEVTGFTRVFQQLNKHEVLSESQLEKMDLMLDRLMNNEPIQYILGKTVFYDLDFLVQPGVLIPRRETEELVDWVCKSITKPVKMLDVGTGSGCIAITLKSNSPQSEVHAWDVSMNAITQAQNNARLNDQQVFFHHQDILKVDHTIDETWDVIVSNPPYVLESDKQYMHQNVLDYEPAEALFVEDDNSLVFYDAIAKYAAKSLKKNGVLFFEIHEKKGNAMVELLNKYGFEEIELKKDLQMKDRMVKAVKY